MTNSHSTGPRSCPSSWSGTGPTSYGRASTGLTDDEYLWEPAQPAWNVRPRDRRGGPARQRTVHGRLRVPRTGPAAGHHHRVAAGAHHRRRAGHAGGGALRRATGRLPELRLRGDGRGGAGAARRRLRRVDGRCPRARRGGLAAPCGPAEGPFAEYSMAALVLHIHREVIHHGAEVVAAARPVPGGAGRRRFRRGDLTASSRAEPRRRPGRVATRGSAGEVVPAAGAAVVVTARRRAPAGRRRRRRASTVPTRIQPNGSSDVRAGRSPPARGRRRR